MLPLFKILLLVILIQHADGNQRIVYVSELISDDEDFNTGGEDNSYNSHICCVYGNCSCSSFDQALANLNSNGLINITTDVRLSSFIEVSHIENVTIIGHNNPTVSCKTFGGIHLNFCNNCIIEGITWDGCGTESIDHTEPGLKLSNSSNVAIKNCFFQHSKGQAVLLLEVSGNVNINHCNFVHNNHYSGHGAAIHYSSNNEASFDRFSTFTINDSNFTQNKHAESLVYIDNTASKHNSNITFCSINFFHNQGVSVYAIHHNINLKGKLLFQNNTAENGTGIYVNNRSTVIFAENSDVTFAQNFANVSGGTVFLSNHSNAIFDKNSVVTFYNNKAAYGGAIYSEISSDIIFKVNCKVILSHSSAEDGGAILSYDNSYIFFEADSSPVFTYNTAEYGGGAIGFYDNSYMHILKADHLQCSAIILQMMVVL